jgi:hypothetical protein
MLPSRHCVSSALSVATQSLMLPVRRTVSLPSMQAWPDRNIACFGCVAGRVHAGDTGRTRYISHTRIGCTLAGAARARPLRDAIGWVSVGGQAGFVADGRGRKPHGPAAHFGRSTAAPSLASSIGGGDRRRSAAIGCSPAPHAGRPQLIGRLRSGLCRPTIWAARNSRHRFDAIQPATRSISEIVSTRLRDRVGWSAAERRACGRG